MKKETIDLLKEIRLGEIYPCCQELDEIGKEKQSILSKLYRIGVLSKTPRGSYKVGNSKLLSKFIELQDFEKLVEYIESEYENKNITNNGIYIESNENNGTQSFEKTERKKTNNRQTVNPSEKKSSWSKIISFLVKFWWLFLIPLIIELIKLYWNSPKSE